MTKNNDEPMYIFVDSEKNEVETEDMKIGGSYQLMLNSRFNFKTKGESGEPRKEKKTGKAKAKTN